jgi:hypothetical protein
MDGFEQLRQSAEALSFAGAYEETRTYFKLQHLDHVQFAVVSIEPRKEEIDALLPDQVGKAPIYVPWEKGIVVKMVPVVVRRWENNDAGVPVLLEYKLFEGTEPSDLVLNYDFYPVYEKLSEHDVTKGFLRVFAADGGTLKTLKVNGFPVGFENWPPNKRFAFWYETISRKFAVPQKLEPGTLFWAYWEVRDLTGEKNDDGTQKYKYPFTEAKKVIKDKATEAWLEAKLDVETMPVAILNEVMATIDSQRAAAKQGSSDEILPF